MSIKIFGLMKPQNSKIKTVGHVDDYVKTMLDRNNANIESIATVLKTPEIKIAQRKDVINGKQINTMYVNSGNVTTGINLNEMSSGDDFFESILDNILANSKVSKGGLGDAFNYVENSAKLAK